jgi:phenylpyruvate tautomerase PptA (4-oxalocrotonate tautomerase family)
LIPVRDALSDVIHDCVVEALQFPRDKRAHRFFPMDAENVRCPDGRTDAYTIIEITMIEGRTVEARKKLVRLLFDRIHERIGIEPRDVEICIQEVPASDWGFRGMHGDEIRLDYRVDV